MWIDREEECTYNVLILDVHLQRWYGSHLDVQFKFKPTKNIHMYVQFFRGFWFVRSLKMESFRIIMDVQFISSTTSENGGPICLRGRLKHFCGLSIWDLLSIEFTMVDGCLAQSETNSLNSELRGEGGCALDGPLNKWIKALLCTTRRTNISFDFSTYWDGFDQWFSYTKSK